MIACKRGLRRCRDNDTLVSTHKSTVLAHGSFRASYTSDEAVIPVVKHFVYSGATISADLGLSGHVPSVTTSARQTINTLFRCFVVRNPDVYIYRVVHHSVFRCFLKN